MIVAVPTIMADSITYRLILLFILIPELSRHPDESLGLLLLIECIYHKTINAAKIIAYFHSFQRLM